VVALYQAKMEARLLPWFRFAGVDWPPRAITLLALKDSRRLELWALSRQGWRPIFDYRIKGISGGPGPKLREGDRQVPEGFYRIVGFNPNSRYHLSIKIDYPNRFDRAQARRERRTGLGGEIFIHGKAVSQGCLAIGDKAIEDLFVLIALVGVERVSVIISPRDYRIRPWIPAGPGEPPWVDDLNRQIAAAMVLYQRTEDRSQEAEVRIKDRPQHRD
jgi:hypothetical protein